MQCKNLTPVLSDPHIVYELDRRARVITIFASATGGKFTSKQPTDCARQEKVSKLLFSPIGNRSLRELVQLIKRPSYSTRLHLDPRLGYFHVVLVWL